MKALKGKILVVDDEKNMREVMEIFLKGEGYDVTVADGGASGITAFKKDIFNFVITDLKMPKVSGFDLLKVIKETSPNTIVVINTAFGTTESAVEAMKLGAFDYIQKPFKMDSIRLVLKNALEKHKLQKDILIMKDQLKSSSLENIIGRSPVMLELFSLIHKVAQSSAAVLISGESGTGKELVARAIHNLSSRKDNAFIAINCAAIPESLLESELFGYMKGAFTGAVSNKEGLFELADDGTLLLDEIGEMPLTLQAKLLRVIEDSTFRRVGGTSDIKIDVRIISVTNRNIKNIINEGRFREDLYFRLNVLSMDVPPLRNRREDIPLLIKRFLKKFSGDKKQISKEAISVLKDYVWKGNVRELENIVERVTLLCEDDVIDVKHLPEEVKQVSLVKPVTAMSGSVDFEKLMEGIEKDYLLKALEKTNGVKTEAAKLLNLSFRSFRHRLKKYRIDKKIITD
ncbi:MAG: sigma-54 dependent transcriptional regulator [Candidatus Mariimomonas ferrooxydans]